MSALSAAVMALPSPESVPCPRCGGPMNPTGRFIDSMGNLKNRSKQQEIVRCGRCGYVWWTVKGTIKNPRALPRRDGSGNAPPEDMVIHARESISHSR